MKVQLNSHALGFYPQTEKLESSRTALRLPRESTTK